MERITALSFSLVAGLSWWSSHRRWRQVGKEVSHMSDSLESLYFKSVVLELTPLKETLLTLR